MGNACDACKGAADYVTDNIEDDGLYKACVQFGWIAK
jgi:hydroxymethylpyrimidine pyrophosphatase-like HAD family hydrolase